MQVITLYIPVAGPSTRASASECGLNVDMVDSPKSFLPSCIFPGIYVQQCLCAPLKVFVYIGSSSPVCCRHQVVATAAGIRDKGKLSRCLQGCLCVPSFPSYQIRLPVVVTL